MRINASQFTPRRERGVLYVVFFFWNEKNNDSRIKEKYGTEEKSEKKRVVIPKFIQGDRLSFKTVF